MTRVVTAKIAAARGAATDATRLRSIPYRSSVNASAVSAAAAVTASTTRAEVAIDDGPASSRAAERPPAQIAMPSRITPDVCRDNDVGKRVGCAVV